MRLSLVLLSSLTLSLAACDGGETDVVDGPDGAAMGQVAEDFNASLDDIVAFPALDVGDEADPAVVVFVGGIVKALGLRHTCMSCHGWSLTNLQKVSSLFRCFLGVNLCSFRFCSEQSL